MESNFELWFSITILKFRLTSVYRRVHQTTNKRRALILIEFTYGISIMTVKKCIYFIKNEFLSKIILTCFFLKHFVVLKYLKKINK